VFVLSRKWDVRGFAALLSTISASWLLPMLPLVIIGALLRGLNLCYLVGRVGGKLRLVTAVRFQLISFFLNSFISLNLTGDVARYFLLRRHGLTPPSVINVIVMDRTTGIAGVLCCLVLFALAEAPFAFTLAANATHIVERIHLSSAALVALAACAVGVLVLLRLRSSKVAVGTTEFFRQIWDALPGNASHAIRVFACSTAISVGVALIRALFLLIAGLSLTVELPIGVIGLTAASASLVSMLPLTAAGLGVAELVIVAFFVHAGVAAPRALSVALLARAYWLLMGLGGAFLFLGFRHGAAANGAGECG